MLVRVIAVGGIREPGLKAACEMYERRALRHLKLDVHELKSGAKRSRDPETIREAEGQRITVALPAGCDTVALTRSGKGMTSRALARYLEDLAAYGSRGVAFVIGGAEGIAAGVLEAASYRLALSPMTMSHELARVVLLEQLYRAGTIIHGEPYHRGP